MFSDLFHKGKVWSYYIKYYSWLFSEIRLPNNIYSWSNSSFRWMAHCWMAASLAIPLSGLWQTDHSFAIIFLPLKVIQFWSGISGLKVYLPCQSSKNTQAFITYSLPFPSLSNQFYSVIEFCPSLLGMLGLVRVILLVISFQGKVLREEWRNETWRY